MSGFRDPSSWTQLDTAVALLNHDTVELVFEHTVVTVVMVQSCELHRQSAEVEIWLSCLLVAR